MTKMYRFDYELNIKTKKSEFNREGEIISKTKNPFHEHNIFKIISYVNMPYLSKQNLEQITLEIEFLGEVPAVATTDYTITSKKSD